MIFTPNRQQVLERRTQRLTQDVARLQRLARRYSRARQWMVIFGAALGWAGFQWAGPWGWGVLGLCALGFGALVWKHRQAANSIRRRRAWLAILATQVARLNLNWGRLPDPASATAPADHPFAQDLSLFGERSLHRLLDVAISQGGSRRLQTWLCACEPSIEILCKRHRLIRELAPLSHFRDRLSLEAALAAKGGPALWDGETLLHGLQESEDPKSLRWLLGALGLLAGVNALLWGLHQLALVLAYWVLSLLLYGAMYGANLRRIAPLLERARALEASLAQFAAVFGYLETRRFGRQPQLQALCRPFLDLRQRPSHALARVGRITAAISVRNHGLVWLLLNLAVPWDLYFLQKLNRYKSELAGSLSQWLDCWYELEALCSLANFAHLHPQAVYPEFLPLEETQAVPVFSAQSLGHPLIQSSQRVDNDFALPFIGGVALVTGSNMSGKSTFLRTLGINLCLAYAGAPVQALSFRTAIFRLFTCIQVSDSLSDGISYFYAEVRRLKALLTALESDHSLPLFFLIDEIFRGTNNQERLIGSQAYVRALLGQRGVGVISTHDLELVKLEQEFPGISNYHFRETIEEGRMRFDYEIRKGPCPTTNALVIMRQQGLLGRVNTIG